MMVMWTCVPKTVITTFLKRWFFTGYLIKKRFYTEPINRLDKATAMVFKAVAMLSQVAAMEQQAIAKVVAKTLLWHCRWLLGCCYGIQGGCEATNVATT